MSNLPRYESRKLLRSTFPARRRGSGEGCALMWRMGIVWALRAVVLLAFPAAFVVVLLHPDLGVDATGAGTPIVACSTFILMRKLGPLHSCPGRHTTRTALRAAVDDNRHRLDQYDRWFRALGINPAQKARKRELKRELTLVQGGDSSPGRRVSLRD